MANQRIYDSLAGLEMQAGAIAARHIDRAFRAIVRGPGVVCEPRFVRYITREAHPFGNAAIIADSHDAAAASAAIEPLLTCGAPAAALFCDSVAHGVADVLRAASFEPHGAMPAMAVDIEALASTALPGGYSFDRVAGGAQSDAWVEAFATGYEIPRAVSALFGPDAAGATLAPDAPFQYFAVRKDGQIVTTSMLYLADGVAGVYCVATIPDERRRGLAAHATAESLRQVREIGYRVGVLQSSPAGHAVYRRLGFIDFAQVPLYVRMPG